MRLILQRVSSATVRVDGETVGRIARGLLVFAGVERGDGLDAAARAVDRLAGLRCFEDGEGKMNLAAAQAGASFLVVSQFTLAADLSRGRRPSFGSAAPPDEAEPVIAAVAAGLGSLGFEVAVGRFGARMEVELVNDGPVTFVLDA